MKAERFYDPRLSPQENKACEMLFNGFSRAAIMDELDIDRKHLSTLFYRARQRGVPVPKIPSGPQAYRPPENAIPIQKLVAMRAQLERAGFKYAGMFRVMSERTGLSQNCIKVRLWKFDHGLKPKYAEGQHEPATRKRPSGSVGGKSRAGHHPPPQVRVGHRADAQGAPAGSRPPR